METNIEQLKYPIGKFIQPSLITAVEINNWIDIIREFPSRLRKEVESLNAEDLQKKYRPNGWTIAQVVHHLADSHINSFIRFKLALTEEKPTIKPYFENLWAELPDSKDFPIAGSLKLLEGLHARWAYLLRNLSIEEWDKEFVHPESGKTISLKTNLGIYAWHCEHHLAHIVNAKKL
ncbi:YfiT family bacillithiol transferase [Sphingobacterium sp. SGL-16]|uniref:YfiT family bacillithiol transferase n=1 Tax=Sphingobacterium sp. SGL-16 TaxID=2710883 RepID=UPI0013E9FC9F|nr:putative metal-dependent hydrolase [Sphingobacterium sp. SGL-16]NGM72055.1 putative metal-dependent hydrolase [Sphingobacterium sp. SGL-16]